MKVQLGIGGSATAAATLCDLDFTQCSEGAYVLSNTSEPGSSTLVSGFRRVTVDSDHSVDRSGNVRCLLRVRVRVPLTSYNVNGVVVTNVPEMQLHVVLNVPKVMASALQGTLATSDQTDPTSSGDAQTVAIKAVAEAISLLASVMTNQPANYTFVKNGLHLSPFFKGIMGVCPMDYQSGDYGSVRVLPPPARS